MIHRRAFITNSLAALSGCRALERAADVSGHALFVPGYRAEEALSEIDIDHDFEGYEGTGTLLTRIAVDGNIKRARFPIRGHGVDISKEKALGIFAAMRGDRVAAFDPKTLDMLSFKVVADDGHVGGGHARFLDAGDVVVMSERVPYRAFSGDPASHFGRIALRDAETLEVIERYSCQGVAPHDIALVPGTRLLAIANYGSTLPPDGIEKNIPFIVEPSITILDLDNGDLVEKLDGPDPGLEIRHLTAVEDAVFAIQVKLGDRLAASRSLDQSLQAIAHEIDPTTAPERVFLPAPMLHRSLTGDDSVELFSQNRGELRQGLSIAYDPSFDQVIASYPSSHRIFAVDRQSLTIRASFDTRPFGLAYPSGLAIIADEGRYAVTGSFENVGIFALDSHSHDPDASFRVRLFRHSHIAYA